MSYTKGQSQFGRGNMWAMIRSLLEGQGSINPGDQVGLGALQVAKATYDFTVDGGAIATIQPVSSPIIPAGAIVLGGIIHASVAPTSGGGATIAIGIGTGAQATAIKAATAIATYALNTPVVVIPVWSAGFFKTTADGKITFTIAAAALTAGKIDVHIVYVMGGE
jgi:hypothetical protein